MIFRQLIYVIVNFASILLGVVQLMMFLRVVFSWIMIDEDGPFMRFLYGVTEPLVMPFRMLLDKIPLFNMLPIDLSFLCAYMILSIVQILLPEVVI